RTAQSACGGCVLAKRKVRPHFIIVAGVFRKNAPKMFFVEHDHVVRCACRKSDSAILVMKAAEDRLRCDDAEALNRPVEWGILVQRAMNARFIIIPSIPTQNPAQVRLPKYDHVVETFPSDRTDQSLDVWILPRRSGCGRLIPNAHGTQPLPEDRTIRSVAVPNKITR